MIGLGLAVTGVLVLRAAIRADPFDSAGVKIGLVALGIGGLFGFLGPSG